MRWNKALQVTKTSGEKNHALQTVNSSQVGDWAIKWQMRFNLSKRKVMHIGVKNPDLSYALMGSEFVVMVKKQILSNSIVEKTNSILGKGIENKTICNPVYLYTSVVQPH